MDEALRKVLGEIEARAISSQREMSIVKNAITSKQRQSRLFALTIHELESLPNSTPIYEGVGKMFLISDETDVMSRLERERKSVETDVIALEKKHEYLEKTFENARMHIQSAINRQG